MAHTLLEECKEWLVECKAYVKSSKPEKIWDEIYRILEFAFSAGDEISKAVDSLNPVAETFRHSNKAHSDVYELFKVLQDTPWVVQEKFLKAKENSDIVAALKGQTEEGLERLVFEERRSAGEKILKEVGFPEKGFASGYHKAKKEYEEMRVKTFKAWKRKNGSWGEYVACRARRDSLEKAMLDERELLEPKIKKILSKVKENLLQQSKISQKEADEWVNNNVNLDIVSINKMLAKRKAKTKGIRSEGGASPTFFYA